MPEDVEPHFYRFRLIPIGVLGVGQHGGGSIVAEDEGLSQTAALSLGRDRRKTDTCRIPPAGQERPSHLDSARGYDAKGSVGNWMVGHKTNLVCPLRRDNARTAFRHDGALFGLARD